MAGQFNTVAVEEYSLALENQYQHSKRKLNDTTIEIHGVVGKNYITKFADAFDLEDRGAYHSNIPRTIVEYTPQIIPMKDKTALVASDIFEQALVNASEIQNLARQSVMALVRQQDQIILNGMVASTPDNTVTAASNLNVAALLEIQQIMDDNDVPEEDRYIVATPSQKRSLLSEEEVISSDYNTIKALVRGEINTYLGFTFVWISNSMSTGGLPKSGGIRKCFAWNKDAIQTPYGIEPGVDRDWLPEAQSNILVPKMRMGSKIVRNDGIILINATEA